MPQKASGKRAAWQKKIKAWQESGISIQKWCLENDENYHQFRYWRQTLKKPEPQPSFQELKEETPKLDIELCYGDLKILFPNGCTTALLEMCIKSIGRAQCLQ